MAWRVARSLDVLLNQLNACYPQRNKASDGSIGDADHAETTSDHNPWCGPGVVTARDFTHDPAHGVDIDRFSDELAASRDSRIKYIIANSFILDTRPQFNPWQWRRYTGANPHTKHLHLSVLCGPSMDDTRPWNLPMLQPEGNDVSEQAERLIREIHGEVTMQRLSGVPGSTYKTTGLEYAKHADGLGHAVYRKIDELQKTVNVLAAAVGDLTEALKKQK